MPHNKNRKIHTVRFTFHSQGQDMETLGTYLRTERTKQGKTLDDIAQETRISRSMLEAIESDREDALPPPSYLRGFLKLYAVELGINVEDLLARVPRQAADTSSLSLPPAPDIEKRKRPLLKIFIAAVIIIVGCIWLWKMFFGIAPVNTEQPPTIVSPRPTQSEQPPGQPDALPAPAVTAGTPVEDIKTEPAPESPEEASAPEPVKKAPEQQDSDTVPQPTPVEKPARTEAMSPADPETLSVQFAARGIVWIYMTADDERTIDITLREGERYRVEARKLNVRLGKPKLVDITCNGVPVPLDAKPGKPLNLVFPDCLRQPPEAD
jgi:cytoskeleton protein RodZ